jgi:glycosyltransferase involved in cell wall biosynthesis
MQNLAEPVEIRSRVPPPTQSFDSPVLPISVIIPVRNEAHNLPRCLQSLFGVGEIYVIDSQSADQTAEIACGFGAKVVQFHYQGGWPKKRQWALDTLPFSYEWVLLLDADEALAPELAAEVRRAIESPNINGYHIGLEMFFLGKRLRHSGASFYKLSLFRRGFGRFECRTRDQDDSMCDMEVHEHVLVSGQTGKLKNRLLHYNVESLSRYIQKHNEYSNWEVRVWDERTKIDHDELQPSLWGSQAQRRRWLRSKAFGLPGSPFMFFFYKYVLRFGWMDGVPGLIYCGFQGIQFFHIKAKIYESKVSQRASLAEPEDLSLAGEQTYVRH